ncbi:PiggyBac transposable element-derived protein 2 [Trichinella patagoniensis]|uniref:PiggyBac transposable element-derived protein 2 n=1 Tax=Trichinella patagoniensis TaxID=990121 RepID=A0A0V1AFE7_9BILA|nr:PiggyBac transposable element-derived protein 2 [Trichinella patagoniensis]
MLSELKMRAIGTIRPYRSNGADAVMLPDKQLMEQKRGALDIRSDGNIYIAKWHNNSIVRIASNFMTHRLLRNTHGRVKGQRIEVQMLNIVRSYNTSMGRIGLLDKLAGAYRPTIRCKESEGTATPRAASGSMTQLPDKRFDAVNYILGTEPQGPSKLLNMDQKCLGR